MNATHDPDEAAGLAALYLAGAMTAAELADYEAHLAGCSPCREELERLAPVAERMLDCVTPLPPARAVLEALLARIEHESESANPGPPLAEEGWYILRSGEGTWEQTPYAGITLRKLYVDRGRRQFTALVRMEPGAFFPRHSHAAAEECLVLEGDLRIGDVVLQAGDFQRTPPAFVQAEQTTSAGCLLLLTSPFD